MISDRLLLLLGGFWAALLFTLLIGYSAFSPVEKPLSAYEKILERGEIRVSLIPSPAGFFPNESLVDPVDIQLMEQLAEYLEVALSPVYATDLKQIFHQLGKDESDAALTGPLLDYKIPQGFTLSEPYLTSAAHLLRRKKSNHALVSKDHCIEYSRSSRWPENRFGLLRPITASNDELTRRLSTLLLTPGRQKETTADCKVVSGRTLARVQQLDPRLRLVKTPLQPMRSAIASRAIKDATLSNKLNQFIRQINDSGVAQDWRKQNPLTQPRAPDAFPFHYAIRERLPKYLHLFQQASEHNHIDWRLLAAMSYQESHWDPSAVSPTGVQGLMMLTQNTARALKVANRLSAKESVEGGSKYLRKMLNKIPERILQPDRMWLALASYNVGPGHLEDARKLTEKLGGNADLWEDVKQHLPKLAISRWHRMTRHGYARGGEPVFYVENIRFFYDVLRLQYPLKEEPFAEPSQVSSEDFKRL